MLWLGHGTPASFGGRRRNRNFSDQRDEMARTFSFRARLYLPNTKPAKAITSRRLKLLGSPVKRKPKIALSRAATLQPPQRGANCKIKRAFDFALSLVAVLLLLPLFVLVAIAVTLDTPGPVFFRQWRGGLNGKPFQILKFRTMMCMEDGVDIRQACPGDARVTWIGRALRKSSLDEIPQLFNVLRGDMSLVGPRPHALLHDEIYSKLIAAYPGRYVVRPGITGWAQVNGWRGETRDLGAMEKRIEKDLEYIRQWSFWFDFVIIARTVVEVLRPRNAH